MHSKFIIQDIFIYPIKSLGGIRLEEAWADERGFQYDRRWMLVDRKGNFLTQREHPKMAFFQVVMTQDSLLVFEKNDRINQIKIPFETSTKLKMEVKVWDDVMIAEKVGPEYDKWFSKKLGLPVHLVKMTESTKRKVDRKYAKNGELVSFADGMPYLIIGQSSLNDLNSKMDEPVPMNRFRPNIVFAGGKAFQEDQMNSIRIGEVEFALIKPCARCVLTTIDQDTAKKGKEPLSTLSKFRLSDNKVLFGQNMVALRTGSMKVGDPLIVME